MFNQKKFQHFWRSVFVVRKILYKDTASSSDERRSALSETSIFQGHSVFLMKFFLLPTFHYLNIFTKFLQVFSKFLSTFFSILFISEVFERTHFFDSRTNFVGKVFDWAGNSSKYNTLKRMQIENFPKIQRRLFLHNVVPSVWLKFAMLNASNSRKLKGPNVMKSPSSRED